MIPPALLSSASRTVASNTLRRVASGPYRLAIAGARRFVIKAMVVPTVGAFSVGLAAGAGLGVLLAPRSGKDTRAALKAKLLRQHESKA